MTNRFFLSGLDGAHLALMMAAFALAYCLPFELVLLSYVILGPFHYLTEISWLRARSFFAPANNSTCFWTLMIIFALDLMANTVPVKAFLLYTAFVVAFIFTQFETTRSRVLAFVFASACGFAMIRLTGFSLLMAALLPTIIHVCIFTFIFMLVGALRLRNWFQLGLVAAYIVCVACLLIYPPAAVASSKLANISVGNFKDIGLALHAISGLSFLPGSARLAGFLSFIYTYHYLNWFIKVRVIRWHEVPKRDLIITVVLGTAAVGLYAVNYKIGFIVLGILSLLHVLVEFPLNAISLRQLSRMILPQKVIS